MLQPLLFRLFGKSFAWVQVEVTSFCNAQCAYCPHTVYRRTWRSRHLSLQTYRGLVPDLKGVNLVYLQGWGEPFLNPNFFTFVDLAKQQGCRVGTTTNGTLFTEALLAQLVESKLDVIAFSLAGLSRTHDRWRSGTQFTQVLEAVRALTDYKRRFGEKKPEVHIAYLLLRSGLQELEQLPGVLQGLGISQVVISTLDLVAAPELEAEALASASAQEGAEIMARLEGLATSAARHGLNLGYSRPAAGPEKPPCPENVLNALVVSAAGEVSPCVFTNVPATGVSQVYRGRQYPLQPLIFGNVHAHSLREIWRQPDYVAFRRSFRPGGLALPCRHCLKLTPPAAPSSGNPARTGTACF